MRLFFSLLLPDRAGDRFYEGLERVRSVSVSGNFTRRENIHLTLIFLGEQPETSQGDIREAMDSLPLSPVTLTIGPLERFRSRDRDTLVRLAEKTPALMTLQGALEKALRLRGFATEERSYRPHLTVGRKVVLRPGTTLDALNQEAELLTARIGKMTLFWSHRVDGILTYTPLYSRCLPFS